jgi:hypothetical protein
MLGRALEGVPASPPAKGGQLDLRREEPSVGEAGVVAAVAEQRKRLIHEWPLLGLFARLGVMRDERARKQGAQLARPIAPVAATGGQLVRNLERLRQLAHHEARVDQQELLLQRQLLGRQERARPV